MRRWRYLSIIEILGELVEDRFGPNYQSVRERRVDRAGQQ
jgi:hypothetical protein